MQLSICIPTFNRIDHLDNCINSILISANYVKDFDFEVCISDNFSSDDVEIVINKYKNLLNIKFQKNPKNLGFALNAIKTISMAQGDYAWLIGNDDLLLPETLKKIKELFISNQDVEYFFINSYFLNSKVLENFEKPLDTRKLNLNNLKTISLITNDKKGLFWDVIDPKVSWDFLIGIYLSIFKKDKWLQNINILNEADLNDVRPWSTFDNTCIHPKILAKTFNNSKSYINSNPLSINLIGEREWFDFYEFIEIVRIPEILDFYRTQGMPIKKYLYCKNFSLRNFSNYFAKIIIGGKKRGLHYVDFKKHFFKNLLYPNVYMSFFYFLTRSINKLYKILRRHVLEASSN
jgi:glycosyltransferase involved in cell wall biosynthesis